MRTLQLTDEPQIGAKVPIVEGVKPAVCYICKKQIMHTYVGSGIYFYPGCIVACTKTAKAPKVICGWGCFKALKRKWKKPLTAPFQCNGYYWRKEQ